MKKKSLIIGIVLILIVGMIIVSYITLKEAILRLNNNVSLDTKNYLTAVEINQEADFILLINNKKKISNVIYLNKESINSLYDKKIENKSIEDAVEIIMENLGQKTKIEITNYKDTGVFNEFCNEINKQLVISAIPNELIKKTSTLEEKITMLNLSSDKDQDSMLKALFYYSLDQINDKFKNLDKPISEQQVNEYATNLYEQLLIYQENISKQNSTNLEPIAITNINATKDYDAQLYATDKSWYYIKDNKVYAYINFNIDEVSYDYCFLGSSAYTKTVCPK